MKAFTCISGIDQLSNLSIIGSMIKKSAKPSANTSKSELKLGKIMLFNSSKHDFCVNEILR